MKKPPGGRQREVNRLELQQKRQTLCKAVLETIRNFDEDISIGYAREVLSDVECLLAREANRISVNSLPEMLIEKQNPK